MERRTAVALSATAHAGLLAWALVAGFFTRPPDETNLQAASVSVISSAEFDALVSNAPVAGAEPEAPAAPVAPA
ncbi:MAG: cell envelope biogenesis protein TolA, partial [Jannaschia sp.]